MEELESKRLPLHDYKATNDKGLLADLRFNNPKFSIRKIFQIYGLLKDLEIIPLKELETIIPNNSYRAWRYIITDIKSLKFLQIQSPFGMLKKHILRFRLFQ